MKCNACSRTHFTRSFTAGNLGAFIVISLNFPRRCWSKDGALQEPPAEPCASLLPVPAGFVLCRVAAAVPSCMRVHIHVRVHASMHTHACNTLCQHCARCCLGFSESSKSGAIRDVIELADLTGLGRGAVIFLTIALLISCLAWITLIFLMA